MARKKGKTYDMVFMLGMGKGVDMHEDGSFTTTDDYCRPMISADTMHEAVDQNGNTLGWGKQFPVWPIRKGTTVAVKPIKPPREKPTAAEIDGARQTTRVVVADQEQYDGGPIDFGGYSDGSLLRVIGALQVVLDSIPAEFRASARCEINSTGGYEGSHSAHVEVTYTRPETDEEVVARLEEQSIVAMMKEREGRAQLAQLQAKYGSARQG